MILICQAFRHALLLFFICVSSAQSDPYVLYDDGNSLKDGNGGFSLCLGASPSNELRDSLLMCRELSYEFCVNSSLVGSVLKVDSSTAKHFVASLSEPTENNIERLAWLIDSALVLLYDSFSTQSSAHVKCAHEWRAWVCSRAFKRATARHSDGTGGFPLPLCADTCTKAENACNSNLQCAARDEVTQTEQCTDFYRDSGDVCSKALKKGNSKKQIVPVFRKHGESDRWWNAGHKLNVNAQLCAILFAAYLATIACR